ncbi:MAG: hypothetical protein ACK55T_01630, partial [Bacteroidota bacterium]
QRVIYMDDYHLKNLLKKYFNLSQLISKREPFGMWRQKRSVRGKNYRIIFHPFSSIHPCIPLKTQNLARTWQRITSNKKGLCIW